MVVPSPREDPSAGDPQAEKLPVIEERIDIGTRVEDVGAVRVRIVSDEREQPVRLTQREESVEVERVSVQRPVDKAEAPWMEGDTLVVPVYAEVPVVKRRLVLVEEVRLRRRASVRTGSTQVNLRHERAVVERLQPDGSWEAADAHLAPVAASGGTPSSCATPPGIPEDWRGKMRQTVVGVFDKYAAAQRAAQQLRSAGFQDSVFVTDEIEEAEATTAPRAEDRGAFDHVRSFFAELFGTEEDREVRTYAEAVRRGGAVVKVEVDDQEADKARAELEAAGAVDIEERAREWQASGWLPGSETTGAVGTGAAACEPDTRAVRKEEGVIPVVQEELQVGKRAVQSGVVRVYAHTVETPVRDTVTLRSEHAEVERRPVDRPATEADMRAFQDRTIEVRETTEQPVVAKTARVVEEVAVGKKATERTEEVSDTVRRTEVDVERDRPAEDDRQAAFRRDFQSRYGTTGERYEDYEPAYLYGDTLAADARYRGRAWEEVEPEARRDWESRYPRERVGTLQGCDPPRMGTAHALSHERAAASGPPRRPVGGAASSRPVRHLPALKRAPRHAGTPVARKLPRPQWPREGSRMKLQMLNLLAAAAMWALAPLSMAQTGGDGNAGSGATPTSPSKPATPGHGMSSGTGAADMEAARQACTKLADGGQRQDCLQQHPQADQPSNAGAARRSTNDSSVSPGTGSGGSESGASKGGTGFPKGSNPNTGGTSGGSSGGKGQ